MASAKKLPSGQWRTLVYDYTDSNGKRHYESFTAETKKESEYMAAEFALKRKGKGSTSNILLSEAMDKYINAKNNILSPSTIKEYIRMRMTYFNDIGNLRLKYIASEDIQKWVNQFSLSHSPKTVRNAHGFLTAVFDMYAPEINIKTTLPQKIKPTLYVPSDSDIKDLLQYFHEHDKDMETAVYLAAFGTLRRSEICALTAQDISDNILYISKAMVQDSRKKWIIKTTKTTSSTRYVEMPEFVITLLPKSGNIININPAQITNRFTRAFIKLGITQFRFHDLRHYAASIMHAIGVPDQYIMQRGGWSSDRTLKEIYRGTINDYQKKYTNQILNHFDSMQHDMQHAQ